MIIRGSLLLIGLILSSIGAWAPAWGWSQVSVRQSNLLAVRIEAEDRAVFNGVLRVGDLAEVEAENNFLAQRVRALDLEVLTMESPRTTITRQQIEYRLLLAGIKREQIALTGFERVTVELQDIQEVMQLLADTISQQCSRKFGTPAGFCQFSLQAEARTVLERSQLNWRDVSVVANLPAELQAGEQLLPVEFYSGSVVTTLQLPVHFRFNRVASSLPQAALPLRSTSGSGSSLETTNLESASLIPANSVFALPRPANAMAEARSMAATRADRIEPPGIQPSARLASSTRSASANSAFEAESLPTPSASVATVSYEIAEAGGTQVLRIAEPVAPRVEQQAKLVSRGSTVRLTQRIGKVSIGLKTAKAAADGRLGEVIEVVAPYKGRDGREIRLLGRVVNENELELVR